MIQYSTAMKTALKWVGIALALLVAFVVVQLLAPLAVLIYQNVSVYHWMGVIEHGRSMIAYLILTLAFALIGLLFLKEWIKTFGSNFWWRDLFQLLLVEAFVLFVCAFLLSKLFGW